MKSFYLKFLTLAAIFGLVSWLHSSPQSTFLYFEMRDSTPLWDAMTRLGKVKMNVVDTARLYDVKKGQELATQGFTTNFEGKNTRKIGIQPCIACHTTQPEYARLDVLDAPKRLQYADSLDLPFLPGAPLYGVVNRVYFFTEDYQSKIKNEEHVPLLRAGHLDLRKAIQTCNTVYGQGRELESWEVESILAYLWTLQIKIGDLGLSEEDRKDIESALENNTGNAKAVNLLRRYYPEVYPATLAEPQPVLVRKKTSPVMNNFKNGARVYEQSCLYCHGEKKYADFALDTQKTTFQFLKKNLDDTTSRYSIYEALRFSPTSKANRTGSPHFTSQRMSDQQIQDLRFYIIQMATHGQEAYTYYKNQK
jgi:mono/diheme cytochrome c family protein